MPKVLVADSINQAGIDLLRAQPDLTVEVALRLPPAELLDRIADCEALIVRSDTQVTADVLEAGAHLQVVGRAGVGVDNIDLEAATRRGVAVVNAPTGNTMAAAEHTIALILALARHVPQADASLKRGEWRRSDFMGVEVRGKVLGIIGLGRVGSQVARRALGLDMRVIAFDPFVAPERAARQGIELATMDELLEQSDFLTIHTPLMKGTRSLLGPRELGRIKKGVRLLNVARGGLIDEAALLSAIEDGRVAGAALDVFSQEPPEQDSLVAHPRIITTPHLGASTREAQAEVAKEVVAQVLAVLRGHPAEFTVNAPFISPEVHTQVAPFLNVAADVGMIAIQMVEGQFSRITLRYQGELVGQNSSVLKAATLLGLLQPVTDERVTLVNAELLAQQHGIKIEEEWEQTPPEQYLNLITVEIDAAGGATRVSGAHARGQTHIVQIHDYWLDALIETPYLLIIDHRDQPGLIGAVGGITGRHDINIASMAVGRRGVRGQAIMAIGLDDPMPEEVQEEVLAIPHIRSLRVVRLT